MLAVIIRAITSFGLGQIFEKITAIFRNRKIKEEGKEELRNEATKEQLKALQRKKKRDGKLNDADVADRLRNRKR